MSLAFRGAAIARTWKLVRLLQHPRGWTLSELAERLECNRRTVMRDLDGLEAAGFPIYAEKDGREKRWKLVAEFRSKVPPPFTVTELLALYFTRRLSKVVEKTPFYEDLLSAHKKIAALLPPASLSLVEEYDAVLAARPGPYKDYRRQRKLIEGVTEAARARKSLDIVYYSQARRATTERRIDPYHVFYFQGGLYVLAHDHLRGEIRIFALDRIRKWTPTDESFTIPEDFDFEEEMRSAFGIFRGRPVTVRIRFLSSAAPYILERNWHDSQEISTQSDGSVVLSLRVPDTRELRSWVLSFGAAAEVLEPDSLRHAIREEARAIVEQADRSPFIPGQLPLPIGDYLQQFLMSPARARFEPPSTPPSS